MLIIKNYSKRKATTYKFNFNFKTQWIVLIEQNASILLGEVETFGEEVLREVLEEIGADVDVAESAEVYEEVLRERVEVVAGDVQIDQIRHVSVEKLFC